jgi:hypothetical protein
VASNLSGTFGMSKKKRQAFYLDGGIVVAENDVVRFAVGDDAKNLKSEVWTFFGSARNPDFYVTSSLISRDQKGSIHPTRAQFSFTSQMWPPSLENWIGPQPTSRHLESIIIPYLADGDHFHVMTIRLPGIGLRKVGRPANRPKPFVLIKPFSADICLTLNLVLYEGDWKDFIAPLPGQNAIAAIRNKDGRSLIVLMRNEQENDPVALYDRHLKSLPVPNAINIVSDDLTFFYSHKREPDQPILITELHGIAASTSHAGPHRSPIHQ